MSPCGICTVHVCVCVYVCVYSVGASMRMCVYVCLGMDEGSGHQFWDMFIIVPKT